MESDIIRSRDLSDTRSFSDEYSMCDDATVILTLTRVAREGLEPLQQNQLRDRQRLIFETTTESIYLVRQFKYS